MITQTVPGRGPHVLSGDFRRTLQALLDAIAVRDSALYALSVAPGDGPCMRQADGQIVVGRSAIVKAVRDWFTDDTWTYHPTVLWTLESGDTAAAVLDVVYERPLESVPAETRFMQMLVFQRSAQGWRLMFDQSHPH